jgi:hypothetical protein
MNKHIQIYQTGCTRHACILKAYVFTFHKFLMEAMPHILCNWNYTCTLLRKPYLNIYFDSLKL